MRLSDYLMARDESERSFASRAGILQQTLNAICHGGEPKAGTAHKIVEASEEKPTPDGSTVTLEDLIPGQASA